MTDPIHVFIVEDHPLVRIGLQTALSRSQGKFVLAGVADCVETFWDQFPKTNPDLILLDIMLPDGSGIDIAKRLREEGNPVRILVLSAETDEDTVTRLLQIGIDGFVSKMVPTQELFTAIEYVYHGAEFYGKDISKIIRDVRFAKRDVPAEFTERRTTSSNSASKVSSPRRSRKSCPFRQARSIPIRTTSLRNSASILL